jgi:ATP-binding cassette subfamily F protein 3
MAPAPGMRIGYFAQHSEETLDLEQTVLDEVLGARSVTPAQVRSLLGRFLFSGDDVYKKIKQVSGGERRRIALAKLVLDRPDVLLLDEPTTHLDLTTLEALEDALRAFPGAMLFVSHDRYFLDRLADRLLVMGDGTVQSVSGPYRRYRDAVAAGTAVSAPGGASGHPVQTPGAARGASPVMPAPAQTTAGAPAPPKSAPDPRKSARPSRSASADDQIAPDELFERIQILEREMGDLSRLMGDPELYRDAVRARETVGRYEEVTAALESLYAALESGGGGRMRDTGT